MLEFILKLGLWLMRRLSIGQKLLLLLVVSVGPSLALVLVHELIGSVGSGSMYLAAAAGFLALYLGAAFYQSVSVDLAQVRRAMDELVQGNLRFKPTVQGKDEYAALLGAAGRIGTHISSMVANVRSNAAFVAHAGHSLAGGNREL